MENNLIYDIGMNNGDDTAYYLSLGHTVIAVEAAPALVREAENRFKEYIENNRLKILNIGIAASYGNMDFYINNYDSVWNSFYVNLADRGAFGHQVIKVKTQSLDQVFGNYGVPYYVKIDIEGNDRIALESVLTCEEKPKYISIELYDMSEITLLSQLGYSKFKIIDQQNFLPLEIPSTPEYRAYKKLTLIKTSKNLFIRSTRKIFGRLIMPILEKKIKRLFKYDHPFGSSGPFGQYLPGKWHSLGEIKEVFMFYSDRFERSSGDKKCGWWIDIHATN
jgi:FkbM family methyltransferase